MVFSIIVAIVSIALMMVLILYYPSIKIKGHSFDTFYLPILLGAIILLVSNTFDKRELINILFSNSKMNPLKILSLFISISFISISLDEAGFFAYMAHKFINKYKSNQYKLFFALYAIVSILTIFTSNDIVVLSFTPFILYFCAHAKINPIPYLVTEFVAANTYSILLPIGNPTNIYLTTIFNLNFIDYVLHMIIPVLVIGIVSLLALLLLFHKSLSKEIESSSDVEVSIKNKPLCIISLVILIITTIMLVISNYIDIEMWLIATSSAFILLIILLIYSIGNRNNSYILKPVKRVPYSLIPFILSMFVIIMAIDSFNIFSNLSLLIERINNIKVRELVYLYSSTLTCNLTNNIPMTIAFSELLNNTINLNYVYLTVIGSNIGALLTPVGALAGIMWMSILKHNNIDYGFKDFFNNGFVIVSMILLGTTVYVLL